MMRRIFFIATVAVMMLAAVAAYGHHSYAATYDTSKEVKVQGKLIQFVFRNPHSYVTIQAPDDEGGDAAMVCGMGGDLSVEQPRYHSGNAED